MASTIPFFMARTLVNACDRSPALHACLSVRRLIPESMRFVCSITVAVTAVIGPLQARAASPVWKVTRAEGGMLYLGGSIHALRKADYPLPAAFDNALAKSSR